MFSCLAPALRLIFVLTGLFLLVRAIALAFLLKDEKGSFIVVRAREDDEKLFDRIYQAHIRINMFSFSQIKPVYVIDCGLSENTKSRLTGYFTSFARVIFIEEEMFTQFILSEDD